MKKILFSLLILVSLFTVGCSEEVTDQLPIEGLIPEVTEPIIEEPEEKIPERQVIEPIIEKKLTPEPEIIEKPVQETVQEKTYELDLKIKTIPSKYSKLKKFTPKYGEVFGIPFFASKNVPDKKLLHAMNIMAQYLDNDEDGTPDNILILNKMLSEDAGMLMFASESESENSGIWE